MPDKAADPCTFVIFGASGDLTRRKLLPALYNLRQHGLLSENVAVVGVARKDSSHESFRGELTDHLREFTTSAIDEGTWGPFREQLYYLDGDFEDAGTYERLGSLLADMASRHGTRGNALFYLATPPQYFGPIAQRLGAAGLASEEGGAWRRVIVEKPFGTDLESAQQLNRELSAVLRERQIYRIDHYLGKETVQNILVFRFANGIFEPIWNRRYIDHVQVMVAESLGVESRGAYYEGAGALRDMVQNHMLQLLALVAMEPPPSMHADRVRDERVKVLEAIPTLRPEEVLERTVRGQYGDGSVAGQRVAGYRQEPKVSETSPTETHAALKLFVENWRWAGVPFYLRTGKRMPRRDTEIVIQFRRPPLLFFPETAAASIDANRLVIHIQPDEGMTLEIKAKRPAPTLKIETVRLDFSYADFGKTGPATGYERLLFDAMIGDATLFHRTDMVEASWRVVNPILDVWGSLRPRDFPNYAAGTWGPAAADALIGRDGRSWWVSG